MGKYRMPGLRVHIETAEKCNARSEMRQFVKLTGAQSPHTCCGFHLGPCMC